MSVLRPRAVAAGLAAVAAIALTQGTSVAGIPANKVAASGSATEVVGANESKVILSETVKINNPTDLLLGVSLECAILTEVTNSANGQTERAFGEIQVEVRINGITVPVSTDSPEGNVVFCNRAQEQQWTDSADPVVGNDDSGDELRQYLDTRTATAFNWMALNVGETYGGTDNNTHKIEVVATWSTDATAGAVAEAVVGNRTLVLEPVKAAVGEVVTELG